jgi:hypothetical protein
MSHNPMGLHALLQGELYLFMWSNKSHNVVHAYMFSRFYALQGSKEILVF